MINHYRTLFLNQTDQGNTNEFICPNFHALTLPAPLLNFYSILFPVNSTRYYQQFIEYYCENLLYSANQTQFLTSFDPRITYNINQIGEYFQYNQISVPISSSPVFNLLVQGNYSVKPTVDYYYDSFIVMQVGSTNNVTVQSTVTGLYLNGSLTSSTASSNMYIPLTFTNNGSNLFPISTTGLSATVAGPSSTFSSLSNTQWTFTVQAPFTFDINTFYNNFYNNQAIVTNMLTYGAVDDTSQALWSRHFNTVYQLAGLFNAYVFKVNACLT